MLVCIETVNVNFPPTPDEEIAMKLNELSGEIAAVVVQVAKVRDEVLARIAALEAALANVELPEDVMTALDALRTSVQAIDDLNPDAVVNPE
jgi:hypothetical protein